MNRIHYTQMSKQEIEYTESLIHSVTEWNFAVDHAMDRMAGKGIKKGDVLNALRYGSVIEVNDKGRVVMRLMKGMMKGTCAVVSVRDRVLVTCWFNKGRDNHSTLDKSEYTWRVNVIEYLRGL